SRKFFAATDGASHRPNAPRGSAVVIAAAGAFVFVASPVASSILVSSDESGFQRYRNAPSGLTTEVDPSMGAETTVVSPDSEPSGWSRRIVVAARTQESHRPPSGNGPARLTSSPQPVPCCSSTGVPSDPSVNVAA